MIKSFSPTSHLGRGACRSERGPGGVWVENRVIRSAGVTADVLWAAGLVVAGKEKLTVFSCFDTLAADEYCSLTPPSRPVLAEAWYSHAHTHERTHTHTPRHRGPYSCIAFLSFFFAKEWNVLPRCSLESHCVRRLLFRVHLVAGFSLLLFSLLAVCAKLKMVWFLCINIAFFKGTLCHFFSPI